MKYLETKVYREDIKAAIENTIDFNIFHRKSILILGASGLIGAFIADCFLYANVNFDAGISIYALSRDKEHLIKRFGVQENLHFIESDVTAVDLAIVKDISFDYIIHAASYGHPKAFREKPAEVLLSNVVGTQRVLELARSYQKCRVLYVSSGEAQEEVPHLSARACYPMGKKVAETLCLSYIQEYGSDVVIARPSHIFGANITEYDNRATAQFLAAAATGTDIRMYSAGKQRRSFTYVADCVSGLLTILLHGRSGKVYGISAGKECTVREFAGKCAVAGGCAVRIERPTDAEKSEVSPIAKQTVDNTDLKDLGWNPVFSIESGIWRAIRIMRDTRVDKKVRRKMESYQISSLIKMIADGIKVLIGKGVILKNRKIILYGLDRYSFAMRTILSNLGFHNIEGYISDDESLVLQYKSEIRNFVCHFLNQEMDLINVWTLEERWISSDSSEIILIASKSCDLEKRKLEAMGYKENIHFFIVCDFKDELLDTYFQGKRRMSIAEIKQTEKEMLGYVDGLCRKHGLRYWVCGGTLLGVIRHKGFIPWDDDIDIFLPWRDYLRFIELFEETERFSMLGFGTAEVNDFPDILSKVVDKRTIVNEDIGTLRKINPLWIDVFPLIGLPDKKEERHLFFMRYKELNRQIWQEFYALNGKTEGFSGWYDQQKDFLSRYDFDKAACVGVLGTIYGERDCTSRQVYDTTLRMQFEDIGVNVPGGYQEYLDNLYGKEWMQLPDESDRKTHHNISVYWDE